MLSMPRFDPQVFNYSQSGRQALARHLPNPYLDCAYIPLVGGADPFFDFSAGNFILDEDKFLCQHYPNTMIDALSQPHPECSNIEIDYSDQSAEISNPSDRKFKQLFPDKPSNNPVFGVLTQKNYRLGKQCSGEERRKQAMVLVCHSYVENRGDHLHTPASYYVLVSPSQRTVKVIIDFCTLLFDKVQQEWLAAVYRKFTALAPDFKISLIADNDTPRPSLAEDVLEKAAVKLYSALGRSYYSYHHPIMYKYHGQTEDWRLYKQAHPELSHSPTVYVGERKWECPLARQRVGLHHSISRGLNVFLSLNNLIPSRPVLQNTALARPRGDVLVEWVMRRAEENFLSAHSLGNPGVDLSLIHKQELWCFSIGSIFNGGFDFHRGGSYLRYDDGELSRKFKDGLKIFSEQKVFELFYYAFVDCHGDFRGMSREGILSTKADFSSKAIMTLLLLDARYNPCFLLLALLKYELSLEKIYIVNMEPYLFHFNSRSPVEDGHKGPYFFGLTEDSRSFRYHRDPLLLQMFIRVNCLYDARTAEYFTPMKLNGVDRNPLEINLAFSVNDIERNPRIIDNSSVPPVRGNCGFPKLFSPYAKINEIIDRLDRLTLNEQREKLDKLTKDYLHKPIERPIAGQSMFTHRNTAVDLIEVRSTRIEVLIKNILPQLKPNSPISDSNRGFIANYVTLYQQNADFRTEYARTLDAGSGLLDCQEVPKYFVALMNLCARQILIF